jgi:hypothetical protein
MMMIGVIIINFINYDLLSHRPVLCAEELLILLINFMKWSRNRQSCLTPVWKKKKINYNSNRKMQRRWMKEHESVFKCFRTESITKYTLTTVNTRWEATQRVMAAKLTRLTHNMVTQLHLVAESCTIRSSHSRLPVRKLLDTPSYNAEKSIVNTEKTEGGGKKTNMNT